MDNYREALTAGEHLMKRVDAEVLSCGLSVTGGTSPHRIGAVQAFRVSARSGSGCSQKS